MSIKYTVITALQEDYMAIEPLYDNLNLITKKSECEILLDVLAKVDIPTETIARVLFVSAFPTVNDGEVREDKINFAGRVVFYVCYQTLDGEIKKYECASEYSGGFDKEGCANTNKNGLSLTARIEKSDYTLSDGEFNLKAKVLVNSKVYGEEKLSVLSGGEGLITDVKEVTIEKSCGLKKAVYPIEEEFELNYEVKEVLSQSANTVITAVQCGVGCIIVDGEVFLSALLLQNVEKSDIIRENKTLPFRMEIEYDEAMPALKATAFVTEKSLKTDIQVDGETGKSIVKAKVNLCFYGEAFSADSVSLVRDAFNKTEEVEAELCEYVCPTNKEVRIFETEISEKINIEDLPAGIRIMAVGGERAEVVSSKITDSGIEVSGIVELVAFMRDSEGKNSTIKLSTPFTTTTDFTIDGECELKVNVTIKSVQVKILSLSSVEISLKAMIFFESHKMQCIKYLKDVKSICEKEVNDCAISVFLPQENEELWSLAKRLNVCPEELLETNKELQFPLTGKERIVIYRQK